MKSVFAKKISAGGESVFLVHGGKDTTGQENPPADWAVLSLPPTALNNDATLLTLEIPMVCSFL
jgi:hypothetical protein